MRALQLNLHGAVKESFRIQREFDNLVEKSGDSYIFGKQFIAEQAIGILDILDRIIFYVNALSDGQDIDLFLKLDKLRAEMDKCFAPDADVESMMGKVIDYTTEKHVSHGHVSEITLDECISAHDIMLHCYCRVFKAVETIIRDIKTNSMGMIDFNENAMEVALNWLYSIEPDGERNDAINSDVNPLNYNSGVTQFIEGINDVTRTGLHIPEIGTETKKKGSTLVIHSPTTLTGYCVSSRFKTILISNLCAATAGNYIYLMIMPSGDTSGGSPYNLLMEKLLRWLDFVSYNSGNVFVSSIKNITHNQMKIHLNMVGKLLCYVSSLEMHLDDDSGAQEKLELFLENIV